MDHYTRALRNTFVSDAIDRLHQVRGDTSWFKTATKAPNSRFFILVNDNVYVTNQSPHQPLSLSSKEAALLASQANEVIFLGRVEEQHYFALAFERVPDLNPGIGKLCDLREIALDLDAKHGALLAQAKGMVIWHRYNQFCSRCGNPTTSTELGYTRECTNSDCGQLHFPRTDPAVIVLVTQEEHCLLGRQARWEKGRYSNIAGFVEPGESLETAVAREVWEETGIRLKTINYHSSQPWPFPSSLMLGFTATAKSEEIYRNDGELEDARWFTREELCKGLMEGSLSMPSTYSISFHLIEDWFNVGECGLLMDLVKAEEAK